jgi:nucleoside 2-deoxyribosyltransferase
MSELSCFVACAFDKEDIDEIYDRAIEPVIYELNMTPYRVDRIEHNENIDAKIIDLIKNCEVCVADLTYARPSVYFEVGYFQGLNKPVVFTIRKDHFIPKENDVHGNFRVHFDLQMKNIIDWSSTENVKTFTTRLKRRLQLLIKPILKVKNIKEEEKRAEKIFSVMPQSNRLASLSNLIKDKMIQWERTAPTYLEYYRMPLDYISFYKDNKLISIFITASATLEYLKFTHPYRIIEQHKSLSINQCHIIIISLRKIPKSRIDDQYPYLELMDEHTQTYRSSGKHIPRMLKEKKIKSYYHFISGIKSLPSFEQVLNSVMGKINKLNS